jgi:hypothetical protein
MAAGLATAGPAAAKLTNIPTPDGTKYNSACSGALIAAKWIVRRVDRARLPAQPARDHLAGGRRRGLDRFARRLTFVRASPGGLSGDARPGNSAGSAAALTSNVDHRLDEGEECACAPCSPLLS